MKLKPETLVGQARKLARREAVRFVETIRESKIPRIAIENPVGHLSRAWRVPDQTIQPYQFGDDASKATSLWLIGLEPLRPTKFFQPRIVIGGPHHGKKRWGNQTDGGQNKLTPSENRATERARTYTGIAEAMASQWGVAN
jgi:hypothetical protein